MKIALVQCPAFGIDRPPLALGYLAAYLRVNNYQTDIFDFNIDLYSRSNDDEKKFWDFQYVFQWLDKDYFSNQGFLPEEYFRDWAKQITESGCRIAGFSVQSSSLRASIKLASELKRIAPETVIIFGGPLHLSYSIGHAYHLLQLEQPCGKKTVDIVAMGEGEQVLVEILNRIKSGSSLDGCQGTVLRENGRIVNNGLCPLIHDLDCLPFPDFSRFPLGRYKHKNRLPILGSRGCIFRCLFCDDSRMWRTYRSRTAENIINEIRIRKEEGVEFLEFNDLLINGNLLQLSRLCELLIKERLRINWGGSAVVDKKMDLSFLKKLKEAGCCYLNYGLESGSPKILREMNKHFKLAEAKKAIKDTYEAGISVCTNWIVGFPTETEEDFQETINFIRENIRYLKSNMMVNSFILKGESLLFQQQEEFGITFDSDGHWKSLDGINTIEERRRRYARLLDLLSENNDIAAHKTFQG